MYGELPGFDDFLAIMRAYSGTWDRATRLDYLKSTERMFDDLLGFAQKHAMAGYDMREWRRKLFIPFDVEYNSLVTNYAAAFEDAQRELRGFPGYVERNAETNRTIENSYFREFLDV